MARRSVTGPRYRPASTRAGGTRAGLPTRRRGGGRPPSSPSGPSSSRTSSRWSSASPTSRPGPDAEVVHDLAAVEVGADGVRAPPAASQLGDALLELVHPPGQRGGLALVAGGAVAAGQLDQLVELVAGVADEPAHRGVGPAHRVGVEPQVQVHQLAHGLDVVVRSSAGPASGRGPCGRRPPRGGGTTRRRRPMDRVLGLPTSWSRAARRTMRSGRVLATTAMVWASTSLWWWIGSCSRRMAGSSGRNSSARPVSTRNHRPADGSSTTISLSSSSRIRSADTISSRSRVRPHRRRPAPAVGRQPVAGDEAGGPQHPQRVVGEGHLGRERGPQPAGGQVGGAVEGVDRAPARADRRAMALTVKSRRDRSSSMSVAEGDLGLAGVRRRRPRPGGW